MGWNPWENIDMAGQRNDRGARAQGREEGKTVPECHLGGQSASHTSYQYQGQLFTLQRHVGRSVGAPGFRTLRGEKKCMQILLSNSQAGPGRKAKQGQEEISCNYGPTFFLVSSVLQFFIDICLSLWKWNRRSAVSTVIAPHSVSLSDIVRFLDDGRTND